MTAQQKIHDAICSIEPDEFKFNRIDFHGEDAMHVTPAIQGVGWTQKNKYLRSVIYRIRDYKVLSASFPKFCNWGENPDNFPVPEDISCSWIMDKIDGSTFIADYINGEINVRTRGTSSYATLENAKDFELALNKYPDVVKWIENHDDITLLFEIVTPNQKIVLDYDEIDIILIGAINKDTYEYINQSVLNEMALEMSVSRPKTYHFETVSELLKVIKDMVDVEGCVLYSSGFDPIKVKSDQYLRLHSFKSNATPKNVIELYVDQGYPSFDKFKKYILNEFDYECWKMVEPTADRVINLKKLFDLRLKVVERHVNRNSGLTDKDFAFSVANKPWRSLAFSLRKGKDIPDKFIKNFIKDRYETESVE